MPTQKPAQKSANSARDVKLLTSVAHLSILAIFFLGPFCMVIPLIIWLSERNRADASSQVDFHAKQAFFYQLALVLAMGILIVLTALLSIIVIGFFLIPVVIIAGLAGIAYGVYGGIQVSQDKPFRYALIADFIEA
ncbi:MAG TPA: DUF4870 domain-containing protein [bacterium]|nr:DUF4870 domain-containing protein [bacterium]